MKEKLEQLKAQLTAELGSVADPQELENLRVKYLGKKGSITDLLKGMKALSPEDKKAFGQMNPQAERCREHLSARRGAQGAADPKRDRAHA